MSLLQDYQAQHAKGLITEDPIQLQVIEKLQHVYNALIREHKKRSTFLSFLHKPTSVKGLYLWGGVGIGKTFLMDIFFHQLPFAEKKRFHFHQFMQWAHLELKKHQGEQDPLVAIAKALAKNTLVICFDEFVVNDIADAMILGRLFKALFAAGVCLVATSNVAPDDLYKKGLQRKLFLPTIELIKHHSTVFNLAISIDYRLRHLKTAGVFFTPNDETAQEDMDKCFEILAMGQSVSESSIEVCDRFIQVRKTTTDIAWFDFNIICSVPRSQHDYLALAKKYRTLFISDIPVISVHANNTINLFICLIDVLYDAKIRLVFSSEVEVEQLYPEGKMAFEYARTRSRLVEMQSEGYVQAID